jgi:TRAP transporter TAXI family solute receptor
MKIALRTAVLAVALISCAPDSGRNGAHNLIIATATPGGTYYPVGVAIGTLVTARLSPDVTASAINSAGSGENIQMLANREAQMAIIQGIYAARAYHGQPPYADAPHTDLRAITTLWQNVEHFLLLRRYVRTGNILDLKTLNDRFSVGKRGSGTEGSTLAILEVMGVRPGTHFVPEYLGYGPSAQAMMDNRIAGASIPAGPPVSAVTQAFAQLGPERLAVLGFSDDQALAVSEAHRVWSRYVIPPGTYPGQTDSIRTIAQPNVLVCRADLPEDVVYRITRTLFDSRDDLAEVHQAAKALSLERALTGLAIPLHPGAARFFRERDLRIPSDLLEP